VEQLVGQGLSGVEQASALELLLGKIDVLKTIAKDVSTSTTAAVDVLDDLLNYDKIESGIFVLKLACCWLGTRTSPSRFGRGRRTRRRR
jgi:hypothetical protein